MSKTNKTISGVLAANVANAGTFVVSYPDNQAPDVGRTNLGDYYSAMGHKLYVASSNEFAFPNQFFLTFNQTNITVTNVSGATWLAGSAFTLELKERGDEVYAEDGRTKMAGMKQARMALINLGAPNPSNITAIRSGGEGTLQANVPASLGGTAVVNGVAILDVPRTVQLQSGNAGDTTQQVTITGKDVYGQTMVERIALNGTTGVTGKKAFATVSRIVSNAATAGGIGVGFGLAVGLPVFLPNAAHIIREVNNGVTATGGVFVAGLQASGGSTNISDDVRGTYIPSGGFDGLKTLELFAFLPEIAYKGIPQFAG